MKRLLSATLALAIGGCTTSRTDAAETRPASSPKVPPNMAVAIFAGGCFWCMEKPFDVLDGVVSTTSGYTAGDEPNPTYKMVSMGRTGHTEAIHVVFDPKKITYQRLLEVFWHNIDPVALNRQFCDGGKQYRTGIYYLDDTQREFALKSKAVAAKDKKVDGKIVTEIQKFKSFWPAEKYHQDYYKKNPGHYSRYRRGCGRDARLREIWGDRAGH